MPTQDVPGSNPANGDDLHTGCWAEHDDGSLLFVEGEEGGQVIYSVFDMSLAEPFEYRDGMAEADFRKMFLKDMWTWHDKTGFPWDRIVKDFKPGPRQSSADATMNAAQRLAARRHLNNPQPVDPADKGHWLTNVAYQATRYIKDGIQQALKEAPKK